jgi:membrane-associated phospholipid phosphatase
MCGFLTKDLRRYEIPNDPDTSYPIMKDTVTDVDLAILLFVIPIGVFLVGSVYHRRLSDLHHALLTLEEGYALVTMFKRWMNLVGRYRPTYQALLTTNDSSRIMDGRQSYPSGHAAYMFLSMTITTLYLLGHSRVFARPRPGNFIVAFFCLAPVVLATFVAVTRPANHRHHFSDINAGMFVGLATGTFAYLLNFESLLDPVRAGHPKFRSIRPTWVRIEQSSRKEELKAEQELDADLLAGAAAAAGNGNPAGPAHSHAGQPAAVVHPENARQ